MFSSRRTRTHQALVVSVFTMALGVPVVAQTEIQTQAVAAHPSPEFKQLITAIEAGEYYPSYPALAQWLDSQRYTLFEPVAPPGKGYDLVSYDAQSGGDRTLLASADRFIPKGAQQPLAVAEYSWSPDHNRLLLFTLHGPALNQ